MRTMATRKGITLMEVLISIGILAVGLTSVVSLVPAGQSQAARAVLLDRAATAAANGLSDAVTFGLTRADSVLISGTTADGSYGPVWIFDPAIERFSAEQGQNPLARWPNSNYPYAVGAVPKPKGVYATSADAGPAANGLWQSMLLAGQSRDDIVVAAGAGPDDPPVNRVAAGARAFQGRISSIFSVALADNVRELSPGAGDVAKLTVVVFHNRTPSADAGLTVPALYDDTLQTLTMNLADIPAGRTFKEIIRPGVVVYDPGKRDRFTQYQRWSQVLMASAEEPAPGATAIRAFVTFASPRPNHGSTVRVLLDSVGMAEQMIVIEGASGYTR